MASHSMVTFAQLSYYMMSVQAVFWYSVVIFHCTFNIKNFVHIVISINVVGV